MLSYMPVSVTQMGGGGVWGTTSRAAGTQCTVGSLTLWALGSGVSAPSAPCVQRLRLSGGKDGAGAAVGLCTGRGFVSFGSQ